MSNGSLRRVFVLAANDIRLTLRDRGAVVWLFVMPFLFAGFFGLMIPQGEAGPDRVRLDVVDLDHGPIARAVEQELRGEGFVTTRHDTLPAPWKIYRAVILPESLSERVFAGRPDTLRLAFKEKANPRGTMAARVRVWKAVMRLLTAFAQAKQDSSNLTPEKLEPYLQRPDLVRVRASYVGHPRLIPGGFQHSVPGMMVMFLLQMALIYGASFMVSDRESGRLRRLLTTPTTRAEVFLGKMGGLILLAAGEALLLGVGARIFFGLRWGNPAAVVLLLLPYLLTVAALAIVLGSLARSPEQARGLGLLAAMTMAPLGGCWWPLEIVPSWLQKAALGVPTGWAMRGMHAIVSFGGGVPEILQPAFALLLFGIGFTVVGVLAFRRLGSP
jgi:ABC-type multidrug transport system permease subunit